MRLKRLIFACTAALLVLASVTALPKQHGRGQGKGKHKGEPVREYYYNDQYLPGLRSWYGERQGSLPPGLAKRDELPPGLARQLVRRGTLPPGLRKKIHPCPADLIYRLPPPPPNYQHVLIGGRIALINPRTYMILDVFHFGP